jgi:Cyclic nucleotide-binding domain
MTTGAAAPPAVEARSLPRLRGITIPSSITLQRVPISVVLLTMVASGIGIGWSILLHFPFYGVVGLGLVPWLPLFFFEAAWKYENYGFYAILGAFTFLQIGHLGEHTAQVTQLLIYHGNLAKAHGIFGNLDLELVHFVWDTGVWLGLLLCAYKLGFRNKWILVALLFSSLHEVEHMFLFYINRTNLSFYMHGGASGIMGKHGLIGSPLARPYLHYIYNWFVVTPLVMAFWDESKHAYNVWLAKALPDLTEQERVSVSQHLQRLTANAGDVIVHQGDTADSFYIVGDGEVEVIHEGPGGEQRVATLGPGQFFGEIGLMTGQPRNATVRATKESELLMLTRDDFVMLVMRSQGGVADLDAAMHKRLAELEVLDAPSPG